MDLPALALTDDGRITNRATGEVLDETAAADALAETLRTYARAKVEADALAMRLRDMEADALADVRANFYYQSAAAQCADARNTMAAIQASLDGLFAGRDGRHPVKVDMGDVMVSWGKARETVTLAHPASWYATETACQELALRLRERWDVSLGHHEALALAVFVRAWLAPTTKTSDLPGASITVRAGKGGGR